MILVILACLFAPAAQGDGATPLHWAVHRDDAAAVEALLKKGANADAANDLGVTPLHLAAVNGNAVIAAALLDRGATPNRQSTAGITPLMEAARGGHTGVVHLLIARGADVNAREPGRQQTALMWAVSRRHPEVVRALLGAHADVSARTSTRTVTVMLDRGPARSVKTAVQDAHAMATGGSTALLFAALSGDAESARLLIAAGANVNDAAADGNSALTLAAFSGHGAVARSLIDAGADVNAAKAGYGPLHAAVLRGDLATVRALIARGADVNPRMTRGSPVRRFGSQWALPTPLVGATPLMVAAGYLELDILRALLDAGADPSVGVSSGATPLLAAAGADLQLEARPSDLLRWNIVDSDAPEVPRDEKDVVGAAAMLLAAGAKVDQAGDGGDTALHLAAGAGLTALIQLLADKGATINAQNKAGQTPLAFTLPRAPQPGRGAGFPGHKAAEDLLRSLGAR